MAFETICEYKEWCLFGVLVLTAIGCADATYQYFYQDQYIGGRRTAATIFLISVLLLILIKCPRVLYEIPLLEMKETTWANPFMLSFFGALFSVLAILCACGGKRCAHIWKTLSQSRHDQEMPHRFPEH